MITYGEARGLARELLHAVGMPEREAEVAAFALATSDAWRVPSHGLLRVPYYLERFVAGGMDAAARLSPVSGAAPVAAYDGGGGLGHPHVWQAAERAAQWCVEYGMAAVAVGNSAHCGCMGVYTLPFVERGVVGLVLSNGPAVMAPWGGDKPVVSTSPIAAGIPCRPRPAIVDLATSAAARGKIAAYAARGAALPEGWAVDEGGVPTVDPQQALRGMLAPLGGGKGFALAFLVEALTGGLVGPALSGDVADMFDSSLAGDPQRIAHLVIGLDPARLDVDGHSSERLDEFAARVGGAGGRVPGASRTDPREIRDDAPLDVSPAVLEELAVWRGKLTAS